MTTLFNTDPKGKIQCISFNGEGNVLMVTTKTKGAGYSLSNEKIEKKWVGPFKEGTIRGIIPFYTSQIAIQIGKGKSNWKTPTNEEMETKGNEEEQEEQEESEYKVEKNKRIVARETTILSKKETTTNESKRWENANNIIKMFSLESKETFLNLKTMEEIVNIIPRLDYTFVMTLDKLHVIKTNNFQPTLHYLIQPPYNKKYGWEAMDIDEKNYNPVETINSGIMDVSMALNTKMEAYTAAISAGEELKTKEAYTIAFQSSIKGKVDGATLGIIRHDAGKEELYIVKDAHAHPIRKVAVSREGQRIATCSINGTLVIIRNIRKPLEKEIVFRRGTSTAEIYDLKFSPDGHYIAGASNSGTIHIWNIKDPKKNSKGLSYYLLDHPKAFAWYKGEAESPCILAWNIDEGGRYHLRIAYLNGKIRVITFDMEKGEDCKVVMERQIHASAI